MIIGNGRERGKEEFYSFTESLSILLLLTEEEDVLVASSENPKYWSDLFKWKLY